MEFSLQTSNSVEMLLKWSILLSVYTLSDWINFFYVALRKISTLIMNLRILKIKKEKILHNQTHAKKFKFNISIRKFIRLSK